MTNILDLLHGQKVTLYIVTLDYKILHEAVTNLGFKGKLLEKSHAGGYSRDTPHKGEYINFQPSPDKMPRVIAPPRPMLTSREGEEDILFQSYFELWNTCYSYVDECPVGIEIAKELLTRNLRLAVPDYKEFTGIWRVKLEDLDY